MTDERNDILTEPLLHRNLLLKSKEKHAVGGGLTWNDYFDYDWNMNKGGFETAQNGSFTDVIDSDEVNYVMVRVRNPRDHLGENVILSYSSINTIGSTKIKITIGAAGSSGPTFGISSNLMDIPSNKNQKIFFNLNISENRTGILIYVSYGPTLEEANLNYIGTISGTDLIFYENFYELE